MDGCLRWSSSKGSLIPAGPCFTNFPGSMAVLMCLMVGPAIFLAVQRDASLYRETVVDPDVCGLSSIRWRDQDPD